VTRASAEHATDMTSAPESGSAAGGIQRAPRSRSLVDPLYGSVRLAPWASALIATPRFQRLAGVSLSDVPGELLFGRPFPSRLDHALGVYHLARLARPQDRTLQAAALAHDLGHGPFSHLSESLMRERLGEDHETRSVRLLGEVGAALPEATRQQLVWLDWDDVARLILGNDDGRGALLNGRLDYDNADNVARFLVAAGLGAPSYDPTALARGLRSLPLTFATPDDRAYLQAAVESDALGWLADRTTVYHYLHEGHHNLAAHAMLRKAVDLGASTSILTDEFFNFTDVQALRLLARALHHGLADLVKRVRAGEQQLHRCVWEAEAPADDDAIPLLLLSWRERLQLEAHLALQSALPAHDVIVEAVVSRASRALPPIAEEGQPGTFRRLADAAPAPRVLHVFAACDAPPDYVRRLCVAAERLFTPFGAHTRGDAENSKQTILQ
jgi:HD superfamily phosphohydrolase